MPIDLLNFVRKWNASTLPERSAAPQHFRDLCEVLDVPHPTQTDEIGASYTFEKRVTKAGSSEVGFADVWKRGFFAWEYKSKGGDLKKAYKQINEYHESLENPPLLIVCDFVRFEVHTKFENAPSRVFAFTLDDLLKPTDTATSALPPLDVLRHVFGDYNQLRPHLVAVPVTKAAASDFLRLAQRMELERAVAPDRPSKEEIAHFLMRLVFCLFADSIELLPNHTFRHMVENNRHSPISFNRMLPVLFQAMSEEGSFFGPDNIPYFNGGLFSDNRTIPLDHADLGILNSAAQHDWSHIEPVIFGTLFERSLDSAKRSMIGAHYTSPEDILLLIEPVVIDPLKRRWEVVRQSVLAALAEQTAGPSPSSQAVILTRNEAESQNLGSSPTPPPKTLAANAVPGIKPGPTLAANAVPVIEPSPTLGANVVPGNELSAEGATIYQPGPQAQVQSPRKVRGLKARHIMATTAPHLRRAQPSLHLSRPALTLLQNWAAELTHIRILDPACGSGNFLYIALKRLLDLWHEARLFGIAHGLTLALDPIPHPGQLYGIEIDFYAHEIASIVVWIGFLQWKHDHGIQETKSPLLEKLTNIQNADAILRYDSATPSPQHPKGTPYEPRWPPADFIIGNPPFLGGTELRTNVGDGYTEDLTAIYEGRLPARANLVTYWFEKARDAIQRGQDVRAGLLATQAIRQGVSRVVLDRIKDSGDIFWAWSNRPWVLDGAAVRISMVGFDRGKEQERLLDGKKVSAINSRLSPSDHDDRAPALKENSSIAFQGVILVGNFEIDANTARKLISAPINPNGRPNSDVVRSLLSGDDVTGRGRNNFLIDFSSCATEYDAALYELPFEYVKNTVKALRATSRSGDRTGVIWWKLQRSRPKMRKALMSLSRYIATPRVSKHRLFVWSPVENIPDTRLFVFARQDDMFFGILHSRAHEAWALWNASIHGDGDDGGRPTYTTEACFQNFPFPWPPGTEPSESDSPIVKVIADAARSLVHLRDNWLNPKPAPGEPPTPESDLKKRTLTNLYNQRPAWLDNAHRALDQAVFAAYGWPAEVDGQPLTPQQILANLLALNHHRAAAQTNPARSSKK